MMPRHTFHITGMFCPSCVMQVERELKAQPEISHVAVSLHTHKAELEGEFGALAPQDIAARLDPLLRPYGFGITTQPQRVRPAWGEFAVAVPLALLFLGGFALLQKLGLVNLLTVSEISYPAAFLIGLVASVSSCAAVVGGITLSVSANFAKAGNRAVPQMLFHAGRLAAFFILGGVLGLMGRSLGLPPEAMVWFNLLVGCVMLVLGINLLGLFSWTMWLQPTLPRALSHRLLGAERIRHGLIPFVLGGITFFLPCGFAQSMQLYALSTGSFITGGVSLLVFALGTLPVLAALSFMPLAVQGRKASGVFFKVAGLVVIAFALFNMHNALVVAGLISPGAGL